MTVQSFSIGTQETSVSPLYKCPEVFDKINLYLITNSDSNKQLNNAPVVQAERISGFFGRI